jgi:acetyl esterase/lipase
MLAGVRVMVAVFALVLVATIARAARPDVPVQGAAVQELTECAGFDLYTPPDRPRPSRVALYIHGGSWVGGDRRGDPLFAKVAEALLAKGLAVASADYRFGVWPTPLQDARCAVAYLRAEYPSVVAWGGSAGGQMALLLAVQDRLVDRAASLAGPTDLRPLAWIEPELFPDRVVASPVTWLDAGDPPTLVVLGDRDELVPLSQLDGWQHVVVPGATHALEGLQVGPVVDFLAG